MASLIVKITGDASGFKGVAGSVGRDLDSITSKTEKVSGAIGSLGSSLSIGLTAPILALGAGVIKTAADMESLRLGLASVAKGADTTEVQLKRLKEVAKLPGLGFSEAIQGSVRLQSAGFSAQLAERSLKAFGNALATVGKGKADLDGVTLALSQIASKGKISAEEINQLAERVPQIRVAMKAAFGTADTEVLQKAGIGAEEFVTRVVAQLEKLKQVSGGTKNSLENLADKFKETADRIGSKMLPAVNELLPKLESLAGLAGDAVDGFTKLPNEVQNTALALGAVAIAAGPVIKAFQSMQAGLASIQLAAGLAGVGLATLFGAVVIAGIVQTMSAIDQLRAKTKAYYDDLERRRTGKQDIIAGQENAGLGGVRTRESFITPEASNVAEKYKIDLKGISEELGLLGKKTVVAKENTLDLAKGMAKASDEIKVNSVAGLDARGALSKTSLVYIEMLQRTKAGVETVKNAMYDYITAGSIYGKQIGTHAALFDEAGLAATQYAISLGNIRRELENMPAAKVQDITVNQRRGTVLETQDILGSSSTLSQSQRVAQAEADLARIKQLNAEGKATGNDVIAAQQNLKKAMEETGKVATTSGQKQTKAMQQVSTVITDLSRGIADIIFKGGKFGDMMANVAKQAGQAITRELIEGALKRLGESLLGIGSTMGKVFGSGGTGVVKSVSGSMGDLGGAAAKTGGIGGAASAASSGLVGIVGAVGSVVSAISGVIGNFQMAGMNKSLDLIEHEVRYSQIHLLNTLNKANEYWPYMKTCWESLIRMEQRGAGLAGGGVQVNMAGAYLLTDAALDDFIERFSRRLKTQGL
ncbi:Caudovirus, tape measure, N-terminal [uncultured Caudovirales phage]|uniref:Caudovirus, tape measure, N-terminal n=1 Tax=uncultured Caudovirales phage TaxID=2100421 RepID=A0A6J5P9Q8_9CAUD|nr:Caudovirus, tape measure, N-terminal [uncultured Caudovirales phage]